MAYIRVAPDRLVAVFDPKLFGSRLNLDSAIEEARSSTHPADPCLAGVLAAAKARWPLQSHWDEPPCFGQGVMLVNVTNAVKGGNPGPWVVRLVAIEEGFATLDCATGVVVAPEKLQQGFDGPRWNVGTIWEPPADWPGLGACVVHSKFGDGRVLDVGPYNHTMTLVVQFGAEIKLLSPEYGRPQLRPRKCKA